MWNRYFLKYFVNRAHYWHKIHCKVYNVFIVPPLWGGGAFRFTLFRLSICLAVRPSVRPFSFVLHIALKVHVFDLESWTFIDMLISMCSCAPGNFSVDIFSIFTYIFIIFSISIQLNMYGRLQRLSIETAFCLLPDISQMPLSHGSGEKVRKAF
jgi:hypothetical protein